MIPSPPVIFLFGRAAVFFCLVIYHSISFYYITRENALEHQLFVCTNDVAARSSGWIIYFVPNPQTTMAVYILSAGGRCLLLLIGTISQHHRRVFRHQLTTFAIRYLIVIVRCLSFASRERCTDADMRSYC